MPHQPRPLAVVTGASTGIGYELAWICARNALDLVAAQGRPADALCANAGRGLGKAFLDQDFRRMRRMIDTNIIGTVYPIQAVYHATKAFIDNFAYGLQNE